VKRTIKIPSYQNQNSPFKISEQHLRKWNVTFILLKFSPSCNNSARHKSLVLFIMMTHIISAYVDSKCVHCNFTFLYMESIKKCHRLLQNPKLCLRIRNSLPLVLTLSQMHPVKIVTLSLCKIYFNSTNVTSKNLHVIQIRWGGGDAGTIQFYL
jgi:hypothetical protein